MMDYLTTLPRKQWTDSVAPLRGSLLHVACMGPNVAAAKALLAHGLGVNAFFSHLGRTPAHIACTNNQPRVLEVLLVAGAPRASFAADCMRVLVANDVRLRALNPETGRFVTPSRAAVVTMPRLKRSPTMAHWDRFLVASLAADVWATREAKEWTK